MPITPTTTEETPMNPLTDAQLDEIDARRQAATPGPWSPYTVHGPTFYANVSGPYLRGVGDLDFGVGEQAEADKKFVRHAREDVDALVAEIRRLRDELAEEKAGQDPRLRCLLVKAAPDRDLYVGWSGICDAPTGVWSRATALEYGFPRSRLDRADANGSSATNGYRSGHWDDTGFVAEQLGTLRRDRLGDYAVEYLHGDRQAAYALLEPFEGETEVRSPAAR